MYQIDEKKLNRLLDCLDSLGRRLDASPFKGLITGDVQFKELKEAWLEIKTEVVAQRLLVGD